MCQALFPKHPYVTLEAIDVRTFAREDPRAFLAQYPDGAIIDEVQHVPDLLSYLQVDIDNDPRHGRWILTGSHNLSLLQTVSQSLAGRTAVHDLLPLTLGEIARFGPSPRTLEEVLFSGGYPRIFDRALDPVEWFRNYVRTFIERDVRAIRNIGNLVTFQTFLGLCAGRTGQLTNYSSLANDCGVSQSTAKAWLSVLEAAFVVFRLPTFHANIRKRLVKMPKIYFHDTGLVCWLLGIREPEQLCSHPLRGAIFETWVISEILKHRVNEGETEALAFYRDRNGAEVDLVIDRLDTLTLLEAKSAKTLSTGLLARTKRIRKHFAEVPKKAEVVVAYGGDRFEQRGSTCLLPWRMLRSVSSRKYSRSVSVLSSDAPVSGVQVCSVLPNRVGMLSRTDQRGRAILDSAPVHVPMTVLIAGIGFAGRIERDWIPGKAKLVVRLKPYHGGGSVILSANTGCIPGLTGTLHIKRDLWGRHQLVSQDIAINDSEGQPYVFLLNEDLHLIDAEGKGMFVRFLEVLGESALLEHGHPPVL